MKTIIKYYFSRPEQEYDLVPETKGASGIDLRSGKDFLIPPRSIQLVETNLHVKIPKGYEIQIRSRSGLAFKNGIMVLNSPGTIDSDYIGNIGVILYNSSDIPVYFSEGDRIAQMVVARTYTQEVKFQKVEMLEDTDRGRGGFGSTGKK